MKISLLNKARLKNFLDSDEFKQMPVIPISLHRGLSHANNPRAGEDDILLILVYNNQHEMIGYLGLLPDDLFAGDKVYHCAWMSCIWVSKSARGQGVAKKMVQNAYEIWGGHILATEFTQEAYRLYKKLDLFDDFLELHGMRVFTRFVTAKVFPKKVCFLSILYPFFWSFDVIANLFTGWRWKRLYRHADVSDFIFAENEFLGNVPLSGKNGFLRGDAEIKWMIDYPWLRNHPEAIDKKYHFSSWSKQFLYLTVAHKPSGNRLLLLVSNGHLKTPFVLGDWSQEQLQTVLTYVVRKYHISVITTFYPAVQEVLKNIPKVFYKPQRRPYLVGKNLAEKLPQDFSRFIQDGDGDCGFT